MSVEVQCPGCGRTYRTSEQYAGRQVKCKACGSAMTVPAAAPLESLDAFAPMPIAVAPPAPNYRPLRPVTTPVFSVVTPPPPQTSPFTPIVITCAALGLALLLGVGGLVIYVLVNSMSRARGPAFAMSDAQLSSAVVGVWTGIQSHARQPPAWGELVFNAGGTGRMRFSGNGKVADADVTWQIQNHLIRLTFAKIRIGNRASTGTSFLLGRVKNVDRTKLVLATQYGDELYVPAAHAGNAPPAGFPQFPSAFPLPPPGISPSPGAWRLRRDRSFPFPGAGMACDGASNGREPACCGWRGSPLAVSQCRCASEHDEAIAKPQAADCGG